MTDEHAAEAALVAEYVAGELTDEGAHAAFEEHLLVCEECWAEVEAGRRGRELALLAGEGAPRDLRLRVLARATGVIVGELPEGADPADPDTPGAVKPIGPAREDADAARPRRRHLRVTLAALAACLAVVAVVVASALRTPAPAPISAAVADFLADRLPGSHIPDRPAPDLSRIGFAPTAAAGGELDGVPVTAYAYRDQLGRRLLVYVGDREFPLPPEYQEYTDESEASWVTSERGVVVLCGRHPHSTLVLARDERLVRDAAVVLDVA